MPIARKTALYLSLVLGIFIVLTSLYGFQLLRTRPGLPAGISEEDIIGINGIEIRGPSDIELVLARKTIGQWASIQVPKGPVSESVRVQTFTARFPFRPSISSSAC